MEATFFGSKVSFAQYQCSELLTQLNEAAGILNSSKIKLNAGAAKFEKAITKRVTKARKRAGLATLARALSVSLLKASG